MSTYKKIAFLADANSETRKPEMDDFEEKKLAS